MSSGRPHAVTEPLHQLWAAAPFRNAYLLRGTAAWMVVRFMGAYVRIGVGHLLISAFVVGVAALLVVLDARRRDEDLFLGNLGIPAGPVAAIAALPPGLLEAALRLGWGG